MAKELKEVVREVEGPKAPVASTAPPSPPAAPPNPAPAAAEVGPPLKAYRVTLKGCRPLVKKPGDPDTRINQDYLDVKAISAGDAIIAFNEYNGITRTLEKHVVEEIAA